MRVKTERLVIFLLASYSLVLFIKYCFLGQFLDYQKLDRYSYINWEEEILFLVGLVICLVLVSIIVGSIFSFFRKDKDWEIEVATIWAIAFGTPLYGLIICPLALLGFDLAVLKILVIIIPLNALIGLTISIRSIFAKQQRIY
ncbi:MAG: hypothetical protein EOM85_00760 [Candidatus Moranbacteria bacterium]|nr:hypothetical protein [Candidatus Moranbacteria bacterium]